ncbi:cyclin-domain-containing protein [Polychaeton citri CBS 116435]|uniref:Cyclin-domain-containing protein n=1 Tax=Polychaeton citri CBS 116435 TaxID=1314669 RepID=A0A9P4UJH6_9PEZI|nr:cyclin-domain-containing protein [Polychaeton citri CBS 116435]
MIAAAPAAASSTTQADTADSSTVAAPTAFAEPVLGQSQANSPPPPETARQTISRTSTPKRPRPHPPSTKLMPLDYSTCNPKDLGHLIATMLNELITLNDRIPLSTSRLTRFHSRAAPSISVSDYLQRLIQHATLSPPILLSMVFYIDRLCGLYPAFTINSLTVHRFLITAGTVASKGLSDSFWTNPTYARIGGIPVSELASLELEFLRRVEWKIVPNPEVLVEYYFSLVERTEGFGLEKKDDEEGDESDSIGSDAMSTNENRVNAVAEGKDHGVSGSGREVENMDEG